MSTAIIMHECIMYIKVNQPDIYLIYMCMVFASSKNAVKIDLLCDFLTKRLVRQVRGKGYDRSNFL